MDKKDEPALKGFLPMALLVWTVGFVLNLVWENAQAPLYSNYSGFYDHFWLCIIAAVIDSLVILLLYLLFILVSSNNLTWYRQKSIWHLLLLILMGGVLAILFERWALAVDYWSYSEAMPVIPILHVGLVPILQLMLLPFLTFWISSFLTRIKLT